jgi:hypothetical protein
VDDTNRTQSSTNDTSVRYRVGLSWTGVFQDTSNASDAMTDVEIEVAKERLVLELDKLYNTSTDVRYVKTWTEDNSTSVHCSVNISWTGVFAEPCCGSKSLKVILIESDFRAYPVLNPLVRMEECSARLVQTFQTCRRIGVYLSSEEHLHRSLTRQGLQDMAGSGNLP